MLKQALYIIAVFLCSLLWWHLIGCAARPSKDNVYLAQGVEVTLLPSAGSMRSGGITQRLTFEYRERRHVFLTRLEFSEEGLALVAMSELGQTFFSMQYKDDKLITETAAFMPRLPPENYLLADLQLIYWPLPLWRQYLQDSSLRLIEFEENGQRRRVLKQGDEIIVTVDFVAGDVTYQNFERGYRIYAQKLEGDI